MLGALLLVSTACESSSETVERNLILVVVDTLRADHMDLYGYGRATTPALDRFASKRAVVFEAARATAPWTKPSVASILTGLDPRQHRVQKHADALHSCFRTLAEAFGENGWRTHGIQSNPYLLSLFGFDAGFIDYEDTFFVEDERGTIANHDVSTGANVNARAFEWLDKRDDTQPFFLYVHHYEPHHMYLREEPNFALPANEAPDIERREMLAAASMDALTAYTAELLDSDVAYLSTRYDSEILYQDRLLGELLNGVEQRGLFENTVVVVTADHGEEFLEHGDLSHHNDKLFDELLRVPLLISTPGILPTRRDSLVSLRDLGRSLLDMCGLSGTPFPGRSFATLLHSEADVDQARFVVAHGLLPAATDGSRAETERECIVAGRWKLIRDLEGGQVQLFDLEADRVEQNDLAGQMGARVRALTEKLDELDQEREGVMGELPPESPQLLQRREAKFKDLEQLLNAMGYLGDD